MSTKTIQPRRIALRALRARRYTVENSWPQVDGGVRFHVTTSDGRAVTVDADNDGKLRGFVRAAWLCDGDKHEENTLLRGAFRAVNALDSDE